MNLKFKCGDAEVVIGNSDQAEKTVFYDNVATGTCPSRVDKSNWLGGDTYGDWFSVNVGPCVGAALGDAVEYDHEDKPKLGSKTKLGKKTEASANTWKAW